MRPSWPHMPIRIRPSWPHSCYRIPPMDFSRIEKRHARYLPHWSRMGAIYAMNFRLSDSLPTALLESWRDELDVLTTAMRNRRLTNPEKERLRYLQQEHIEQYLDNGYGSCWLRNESIASLVADAFRHFEGKRYRLFAWCIMPNHVHVVMQPHAPWSLSSITHSWKSFTALNANKHLKRSGAFWQEESYDHLIRDEEDLFHAIRYTWNNPDAATLQQWQWRWRMDDGEVEKLLDTWDHLR